MKSITIILLAAIFIIGTIAIIITKLYYKKKEAKDEVDFNKELNLNKGFDSPNQCPRNRNNQIRGRKEPNFQQNANGERELVAFSQTMPSKDNKENMFNDYYGEPINNKFINGQNRRPVPQSHNSQRNSPKNLRQVQTPKTQEINKIINEQLIKPAPDAEKVASKISQDLMTVKQKEFIKEQKKGKIKVIKSNQDEDNLNSTENNETKFGEIKRVDLSGTPVVTHTESSSEPLNVDNVDPKKLEKTLEDLLKDSNIENNLLIQEIYDNIRPDKSEETNVKTENPEKKDKIEEKKPSKEETKDKSYIGKIPVFKKDNPKTGETTLDDHHPQGYVDDIPNRDSLEIKNEDEEEYDNVIIPIYNDKNVKGAVKNIENLISNLTNEEEEENYEDDFISITPLSEEEIRVEFQEESATINPIEENESETLKEFKNKTAKEKAETKKLQKLREENTKKLFNVSKENKESLNSIYQDGSSINHKVESINSPEVKEEIVIDGEIYEITKGMIIMFIHNNETYSSTVLALKPGFVGVKYRGRNVWVKHSKIKKVFR